MDEAETDSYLVNVRLIEVETIRPTLELSKKSPA